MNNAALCVSASCHVKSFTLFASKMLKGQYHRNDSLKLINYRFEMINPTCYEMMIIRLENAHEKKVQVAMRP